VLLLGGFTVALKGVRCWCVKVLLLDEITVDMDVVGRLDLLDFFRQECEERGATILYATHIFDGLEAWITHIAYIAEGGLVKGRSPPPPPPHCAPP
jgi:ABC-type uncharacterized transport system ATPase subunit